MRKQALNDRHESAFKKETVRKAETTAETAAQLQKEEVNERRPKETKEEAKPGHNRPETDDKSTQPIPRKQPRSYKPPMPVSSKTFREQVRSDRESFSHKSAAKPTVQASEMQSFSALRFAEKQPRSSGPFYEQPKAQPQTSPFRKSNTAVNNYIAIQNESETNWNLKTKSEGLRPSNSVSIDPEKMRIRGYLDQRRSDDSSEMNRPIMEIVNSLLESRIINTLIEVPLCNSQRSGQRPKLAVLTADERMYQKQKPQHFMSHAHNNRIELSASPQHATSELPEEDTEQEVGQLSAHSYSQVTPEKNVFSEEKPLAVPSRAEKKSYVSSNISFGFMKSRG